jgi:predicted nucleic acid-binding Zn ribbon protein
MKNCIVCETNVDPEKLIAKHEVYFCSEKCLLDYEEKLKKLDEIVDWDKCC